MKIRLLKKKDALACSKITEKNYSKEYQQSSYTEVMSMFSNSAIKPTFYVAEDRGKILGFAGYVQTWADYNIYQIFWVNVLPDYQRKGIGRELVGRVIKEVKKDKGALMIHLTATHKNSIYYKRHFGFKTLKRFKNKALHFMSLDLRK